MATAKYRVCSCSVVLVQRLVERLRWTTTPEYLEIFALCQCIPGPASTQVSLALVILRKGLVGASLTRSLSSSCEFTASFLRILTDEVVFLFCEITTGGLLSGILFHYPGAILMTAIGVFAAKKLENPQGWLQGIAAGKTEHSRCSERSKFVVKHK